MPQAIDREGTFRGRIIEHSINLTKNGYPQFVARLEATEYYDEETTQWVPWNEYEARILAFLVLYSDKPLLNHEQVQKAVGWDGASYAGLAEMDLGNTVVQFRVENNTFEGKTTLQVKWLDALDADPNRTLKRLDASVLKSLDAKFAVKKAATPAKAPTPPPKAPKPPVAKPADPIPSEAVTGGSPTCDPEQNPSTETGGPATLAVENPAPTGSPSNPPAPPKKRGRPAKKAEMGGLPPTCTKLEAWTKVFELKAEACTDEMLADGWTTAFGAVVGEDTDEDSVTPEQWATIRDKTLDAIPHIPF